MSDDAKPDASPTHRRWLLGPGMIGAIVLVVLSLGAAHRLELTWDDLALGMHALEIFVGDAFPPDLSILDRAWDGIVDTVLIAFLATVIGLALSLPLAMVAARNLFPAWVALPLRWILAAVRVLPSFLWAILFVIIVGPGNLAGVLAMALYTIGYLGKLQYETIEGLPRITLDTARTMGLPKHEQVRYVVLPEAANNLVSQALFMFEYNVRATSIIGVVGAGGIGFLLNTYLAFRAYDRVVTILLMVFALVVLIDAISLRIRRTFLEDADQHRPTWRQVMMPWLQGPS